MLIQAMAGALQKVAAQAQLLVLPIIYLHPKTTIPSLFKEALCEGMFE